MSRNSNLLARRAAAVARGVASATPVFADRAENAELFDVDGKRYIDFAGGIAVLNTGHRHPKVVAAVEAQLARFTHTAFQVAAYEPYIDLAERLNDLAPISGPTKSILFTTGAEATENGVKLARAATGRSAVIAFTGGFHGRTMLTMGLTGKVLPYKHKFGPMPGGLFHVPFPIKSHGVSVEDTLKALEFTFRADVGPKDVAAIIIEPVQGEGGFHQAPADLMHELRRICDEHGIMLISDEVQAGFGRTGKMFGVEHYDIEPDLICVAKSLAGGLPLSAVVGKAEVMDAADPGGLGGTYAGSPLACAAALAVLDVIKEEDLLTRANEIGDRIKARLTETSMRNDTLPISAIRGPGAMIGFDIVKSAGSDEPDADATKRVTAAALEKGLILLSCGVFGNTIRVLVPLTVSNEMLEEGLDIIDASLAEARQ